MSSKNSKNGKNSNKQPTNPVNGKNGKEPSAMFTMNASELKSALATMKKAMPRKSTLYVLMCARMTYENGGLNVRRTALDVDVVRQWQLEGEEGYFDVVVDAKELENAAAAFKKREITVKVESYNQDRKQDLVLTDGVQEYRIPVMPNGPEEYPQVREIHDGRFEVDAASLKEALALTTPFVAVDESRPILCSVNFRFGEHEVDLAATDGFRLGYYKGVRTATSQKPTRSINVPAHALEVLGKVIEGEYVDMAFEWKEMPDSKAVEVNTVFFWTRDWKITAITVKGNYPDYHQIMPKHHNTEVEVEAARLFEAAKTVEPVVKDHAGIVKWTLENNGGPEQDVFAVEPTEKAESKLRWVIPGDVVGQPLQIAFNATYLKQAFGAMGKERVKVRLNTPSSPAVFKKGDQYIHVLMPMHLSR